jgi:hypothetical protein
MGLSAAADNNAGLLSPVGDPALCGGGCMREMIRSRQARQRLRLQLLQGIILALFFLAMMIVLPDPPPQSDLTAKQRTEVVSRWDGR